MELSPSYFGALKDTIKSMWISPSPPEIATGSQPKQSDIRIANHFEYHQPIKTWYRKIYGDKADTAFSTFSEKHLLLLWLDLIYFSGFFMMKNLNTVVYTKINNKKKRLAILFCKYLLQVGHRSISV